MANWLTSLSGRGGSYCRLFGLCEDHESMLHHRKMTLLNGRARSVVRHPQLVDLHGYQAHVAIKALIALTIRTGAPLDEFILGLDGKEIVLLALTAPIGTLTFSSGRASVLHGAQHLAVFASFVFLSLVP